MKKLKLLCLMLFVVSCGFAQNVGIQTTKDFLNYATPKLKSQKIADIVKDLPDEWLSRKNELDLELRNLDNDEILSLAKSTKTTSQFIRAQTLILIDYLDVPVKSKYAIYINMQKWGAVGDGVTDNYLVYKKAIDTINSLGSGEIFFPKGRYYIDRFYAEPNEKISGKPTGFNIDLKGYRIPAFDPKLVFSNLKGVKISGESGSEIIMKGDFNRAGTRQMSDFVISSISAVGAIVMENSTDIIVSNLEFSGGIEKTTKDTGVNESGLGSLIKFTSCSNGLLENIFVHHAQTDGLVFSRNVDTESCDNFTVRNVKSTYNARQGMTLAALKNSVFIDCDFSNTGTGQYTHDPRVGIDIEPNVGGKWLSNTIRNDNLEFRNCTFDNNSGGAVRLSHPGSSNNIRFIGCEMSNKVAAPYFIIVNTKNILFDSCLIDAGKGFIYPLWSTALTSVVFKNSILKGTGKTIIAQGGDAASTVSFINNTIQYVGTEDNAIFPQIRIKNGIFENNTIVFPKNLKWRKIVTVPKETSTQIIRN